MKVLLTGVRTSLARHLARYLLSNGHSVAMVARRPFQVEKPRVGCRDDPMMWDEADDYSSGDEEEDRDEAEVMYGKEYRDEACVVIEQQLEGVARPEAGNPEHCTPKLKVYEWDIARGYIDERALEGVEAIVHLACGSLLGVSSLLGDAKVLSTELLLQALRNQRENTKLKVMVFASSVAYYGDKEETMENVHEECEKTGEGDICYSCSRWESCAKKFESEFSVRTVILRMGSVLCESGGVLMRLCDVMSWHMGCCLGEGKQWFPWVHIEDVARICLFVIEKSSCSGVYNCVIPQQYQIRYAELLHLLATKLRCYYWIPNVPKWIVTSVLDQEMASFMLYQARVSASKITAEGFTFKHSNINRALDLLLEDFLTKRRKKRSPHIFKCFFI